MIELHLVGVRVELPTHAPILLLKESAGERFLPIFIGGVEANAIVLALQGYEPPRPLTHDLLKNVLEEMGARIEYITITELRESTFYASVRILHGTEVYEISSRPSDAIALAVRTGVPIYASDEVLEEASIRIPEEVLEASEEGRPLDKVAEQELEKFREFLEEVSPEDFRSQ